MESRRQKKVASLIQETISEIFQKHGATYYGRAFVTITDVKVTPDLLIARIYVSVYNVEDKQEVVDWITEHTHDIRGRFGNKLRNQLRRVPELEFYLDPTLDRAMRINEILKNANISSEGDSDQGPSQ